MIDWQRFTERHTHLDVPLGIEVVAYERKGGGWDLFLFEPPGSCPELESARVDDQHLFIETVSTATELDQAARTLCDRLGSGYKLAVYFREAGGRRTIGQLVDHLRSRGAHQVHVRSVPDSTDWELVLRQKDFAIASEFAKSNV